MKQGSIMTALILALFTAASFPAAAGTGPPRTHFLLDGYEQVGATMGSALASGDFDGDGTLELAAGAPLHFLNLEGGQSVDAAGIVYIYRFENRTPVFGAAFLDRNVAGQDVEKNDAFGTALAVGDFNGDGADDLAVGVPGQDVSGQVQAGAVRIFFGDLYFGLDNPGAESLIEEDLADGAAEAGARFGEVLAAGDLNGDGRDDLVIGCPSGDVGSEGGSGEVYVVYGHSTGLDGGGMGTGDPVPLPLRLDQAVTGVPGASEAGDHFGGALAVGHLNDDAYADLVVGLPEEDINMDAGAVRDAGAVIAFLGSAGGIAMDSADWADIRDHPHGLTPSAYDRFGACLALPPAQGPGQGVLAISTPGFDPLSGTHENIGFVFQAIYESGALKFGPYTALPLEELQNDAVIDGPVLIADIDGDGVPDLLMGLETWDVDDNWSAGAVLVVKGREDAAGDLLFGDGQTLITQFDRGMPGTPAAYDLFGSAFTASDFNGDGRPDIAVGLPGYDVFDLPWSGVVSVGLTLQAPSAPIFLLLTAD